MCRIAICNKCGEGFTPRCQTGPAPKTCYSCRSRVCPECGKRFKRKPKKDKSKDAGIFCSRKCSGKCKQSGRLAGTPKSIAYDLACWSEEWMQERGRRSECRWCGKEAFGRAYCNRKCSSRWHHFSKKPSDCVKCGASLAGLMYQSRSMCAKCRKRRSRQLKKELRKKYNFLKKVCNRCKHYKVAYDPAVKARLVFERDGFRCQICKAKCLDRFRWVGNMPHVMSPTVDHIMPLSWRERGHTWDNVQCCCWSCNVKKSNKGGGQSRFAFAGTGAAK